MTYRSNHLDKLDVLIQAVVKHGVGDEPASLQQKGHELRQLFSNLRPGAFSQHETRSVWRLLKDIRIRLNEQRTKLGEATLGFTARDVNSVLLQIKSSLDRFVNLRALETRDAQMPGLFPALTYLFVHADEDDVTRLREVGCKTAFESRLVRRIEETKGRHQAERGLHGDKDTAFLGTRALGHGVFAVDWKSTGVHDFVATSPLFPEELTELPPSEGPGSVRSGGSSAKRKSFAGEG